MVQRTHSIKISAGISTPIVLCVGSYFRYLKIRENQYREQQLNQRNKLERSPYLLALINVLVVSYPHD